MVRITHRIGAVTIQTSASSNVAIGTAATFVLSAALMSLAIDRQDTYRQTLHRQGFDQGRVVQDPNRSLVLGNDWSLRGTLAPTDEPVPPAAVAPRRSKAPIVA